ncbi:MAG: TspO/MBR family protein [Gammaproteobacteria bacterium]|nr:TspO/MBR family protein [Gammaproteobacteria bacterium]
MSKLNLILWIVLCMLAGIIGSLFGPGEWYISLQKSSLTPPNIVFPIVWNILFVLMGIAAWRVSQKQQKVTSLPIALFLIQLGFNILWSYLFFGVQRPDLALIDIIILWSLILFTTFLFYRIDKVAGALMIPYLGWVGFAIFLNYSIYNLN